MNSSSTELIFVLILMAVLTVFAFTAVFIFLKVMRQERKAKEALRNEKKGESAERWEKSRKHRGK